MLEFYGVPFNIVAGTESSISAGVNGTKHVKV